MKAKRRILLLIHTLLLGGIAPHLAGAQETPSAPPTPLPADSDSQANENADVRRILQAMRDADAKAALDIYQAAHDPVVHAIAAMIVERTRFNLDAASKDAKVCEDALFATKPATALLCGQFISGNLRLTGDRKAADQKEAELVRRYAGHGLDKQIASMQKYLDEEAGIPPLTVERPASDVVITLKRESSFNRGHESLRPTFAAKANGQDFDLLFDTGATNLVLGQDNARDLGVKLLDQKGHTRGWLSTAVPTQRGLLDTLQFGGITLHHVPVRIVPRKIALIGADLLAPLGALRVNRSTLTIYAPQSAAQTCPSPLSMQIGTDLWGRYLRILPEFLLNDQPHRVMLDTGAGMFLIGTKAALDEVVKLRQGTGSMNDIGGHHAFTKTEVARVNVTIGNQPFKIYFTVYADSTNPHDITLGAGALEDMDFVLDFPHQQLCFPMRANLH